MSELKSRKRTHSSIDESDHDAPSPKRLACKMNRASTTIRPGNDRDDFIAEWQKDCYGVGFDSNDVCCVDGVWVLKEHESYTYWQAFFMMAAERRKLFVLTSAQRDAVQSLFDMWNNVAERELETARERVRASEKLGRSFAHDAIGAANTIAGLSNKELADLVKPMLSPVSVSCDTRQLTMEHTSFLLIMWVHRLLELTPRQMLAVDGFVGREVELRRRSAKTSSPTPLLTTTPPQVGSPMEVECALALHSMPAVKKAENAAFFAKLMAPLAPDHKASNVAAAGDVHNQPSDCTLEQIQLRLIQWPAVLFDDVDARPMFMRFTMVERFTNEERKGKSQFQLQYETYCTLREFLIQARRSICIRQPTDTPFSLSRLLERAKAYCIAYGDMKQ